MDLNNSNKGAYGLLKGRKLPIKGKKTFRRIYNHLFRSEKDAQVSLYISLMPYNYFDESWYRQAYQDPIEFSDDPLMDYLRASLLTSMFQSLILGVT